MTKAKARTATKTKKRRRLSAKNLGWAISWGLYFSVMIQLIVTAVITIRNNGDNPISGNIKLMLFYVVVIFWTGARNKVGPIQYLREYKRRKK